MKEESGRENTAQVWVDETNRIISFKQADGFEKRDFPTHNEMMEQVIKLGASGYRIQ